MKKKIINQIMEVYTNLEISENISTHLSLMKGEEIFGIEYLTKYQDGWDAYYAFQDWILESEKSELLENFSEEELKTLLAGKPLKYGGH